MEKIASFTVNHLKLKSGLYVSRKDKKNNEIVTTFDLRVINPYVDKPIDINAMHTIEHLGATYFRNSKIKDEIIYFGPMGCRTGFYLVAFGDLNSKDIYKYVDKMCDYITEFSGEICGAKKVECGNYKAHNLKKAQKVIKEYKKQLSQYKRFEYEK